MTDGPIYEHLPEMTKEELIEASYDVTGGNVGDLSLDRLVRMLTIASFVADLCLNEFERRGELAFIDGMPVVPYCSEHDVKTVLTRNQPDEEGS
jgi:hypothetical protein